MLSSERDKLTLIADEATSLALRFETIGPSDTPITFDSGILPFEDSTTVSWRLESGKVQADLAFSTSAAHQHIYDIEPTHDVPSTPDYQNYKTTSISTAFIEGSLRVYINGTRLSQDQSVYAPGPTPADDMVLNSFTPDYLGGTFVLENAITSEDVIRIDFDITLV
jgi:hypothetical protein